MPNHDQILANFRTTLGAMTVAGGYGFNFTGAQILNVMRAAHEVEGLTLPVICVFPAKSGTPPPTYFPFSITEEYLDIVLIVHLADSSETDRELQLATIEDDIRRALKADPTRGGWAVDTVKISAPVSDEGAPDKQGSALNVCSLATAYRVTYYPDG